MSVDSADAAASLNAAAAAAARNVIIGWRGNEEEKQADANFIVFLDHLVPLILSLCR